MSSFIRDIAVEYVMSPIPDVHILTASTYVESVHSETHVESCRCRCCT